MSFRDFRSNEPRGQHRDVHPPTNSGIAGANAAFFIFPMQIHLFSKAHHLERAWANCDSALYFCNIAYLPYCEDHS